MLRLLCSEFCAGFLYSVKTVSFSRPFHGLFGRKVVANGGKVGVDGSGKGIMSPSSLMHSCKYSSLEVCRLFMKPPRLSTR